MIKTIRNMRKYILCLLLLMTGVANGLAARVVDELPAEFGPEDFTATLSEDGNNVVLRVKLPTKNTEGLPLTTPLTKVEFGEMNDWSFFPEVIYTEQEAEILLPGSVIEYEVEKVENGYHVYTVQVYTAYGSNIPAQTEMFVGHDKPGMVRNLAASITPDGILVSWEAPDKGMNGGDQGPVEELTYTVMRGLDGYDPAAVVVAKDVCELSVLDKTQFEQEVKFVYIVTATSPYGEGFSSLSNEVVMGQACALPFVENFDVEAEYGSTLAEHSTWTKDYSGYFCAWQLGQEVPVNGKDVKAHNGRGLLYAYYNEFMNNRCWDTYTTGNISFAGAKQPTLTLWLYDIKTEVSDVTLRIQTSVNGSDFEDAKVIALGAAQTDGWQQVTVDMSALAGLSAVQIRLRGESAGYNSFPIVIDELAVFDASASEPDEPVNPDQPENPDEPSDPDTPDNPGTDEPGDEPIIEDIAGIRVSAVEPQYQLEALGMSANHRYVCGLNVATYRAFCWDTQTGKVTENQGDYANCDFRAVTNNGQCYGVLGMDDMVTTNASLFDKKGVVTTVDEEMSQIFAVTPDGSIAAGCLLDPNLWLPSACIWKDGERIMLPCPTKAECGIENDGANALYISEDGSVVAGYLQDWHSSRPAIVWFRQEDGSYRADVISSDRWELNYGEGKKYMRFQVYGLSPNGEWLCLSGQKEADGGQPTPEFMIRMNLKNGQIIESQLPQFDYFEATDNIYPTAISNDGTCVGVVEDGMMFSRAVIWPAGLSAPRLLADYYPEYEQLQEYDCFQHHPVAITADGSHVAGFGIYVTVDDDGETDMMFQSYLLPLGDVISDGLQIIGTGVPASDEAVYSLSGIRMQRPTAPGIYVRGGKKVIIR